MARVSTNISLDPELKKASQELYSDLGMDLSTAITIFLRQSIRIQGLPFILNREIPNAETKAALDEYNEMKTNPNKYKRYTSFKEMENDIFKKT